MNDDMNVWSMYIILNWFIDCGWWTTNYSTSKKNCIHWLWNTALKNTSANADDLQQIQNTFRKKKIKAMPETWVVRSRSDNSLFFQ